MKNTSEIQITDAHMHLPTGFSTLTEQKEALLQEMSRNGVCRGVILSDSELESSIGSLTDCAELFKDCMNISVVGGISPYIQYERQLAILERYIAEGTVVGIKLYCGHEPLFLNDPILQPVFGLAQRYRVPVLFHSGWDNAQYTAPDIIRQTAIAHPHITLVCCHCCCPDISACFNAADDLENVYFDISSIADSDPTGFKPILEQAICRMPERFIFGSDFGSCSQKAHLDFVQTLHLTEKDRHQLLYRNAEHLYFKHR